MSGHIPLKINPFDLCARGEVLEGTIPLEQLPRLKGLLKSQDGDVAVKLAFDRQSDGLPTIIGLLSAELTLTCQRCGGTVGCDINVGLKISPVVDDKKAKELSEEFDPWLITDETVSLGEMIEEELLLSLPMIPKHEQGKCPIKLPDYLK